MIIGALLAIGLLVGLLSGLYPALFLSRFSPIAILKGEVSLKSRFSSFFRKGLIVFQFLVSSVLIISTVVIYYQLSFLRNKSLGFDKEQTVVIDIENVQHLNIRLLKDQLNQLPQVEGASVSSRIPGYEGFYDYNVLPEGSSVENNLLFMRLETDLDFVSLYDFEIVAGRGFDWKLGTDSATYLLNQTAIEKLGWQSEEALGKHLYLGSVNTNGSFRAVHQGRIIGVVKDFNFKSLHNEVDPVVISIIPANQPYMQQKMSVKLSSGTITENLEAVKQVWSSFAPNNPIDYFFLDDAVQSLYESEEQIGEVFLTFSSISIVLACLGLFAMTSLMAAQLKREVGIRKVLGAKVGHVVWRISSGFVWLILTAFVIGCLISYLVLGDWLENFAYQIGLAPHYFLISGAILAIIVFGTLSIKSFKAAQANPVDSLRQE